MLTGHLKDALKFDGTKDYVNLTTLGNFGAKVGSSTFEAWIKTDYKDAWTTLFKVRDHGNGFKIGMGWGIDINRTMEDPKNQLPMDLEDLKNQVLKKLVINDHLIYAENVILTFLSSFKTNMLGSWDSISMHRFRISDGEWHHLVYTIKPPYTDEKGNMWVETALFIDGVLSRIAKFGMIHPIPNKYIPFFEPIYLGAGNNRGQAEGFFNGIIDEVRIYNRPLTEAEIMRNYQSTIGLAVEHTDKLSTVWGALKKR